jgi:hypothetical protein
MSAERSEAQHHNRAENGVPMFDEQQMTRLLALHSKSYALLRWVKESLRTGRVSFSVVHDAGDSFAAAEEWFGRHWANLPEDVRPAQPDVPILARLFVSFLATSFLLNRSSLRRVSPCGCGCPFCSYLQVGPNLDLRTPSKKDFERATQLKRIYLSRMASELTLQSSHRAIEVVLARSDLRESLAIATWGAELLRRAEFRSQGEAVLALWREFAWSNGKPNRTFKITARAVCAAERLICDSLVAYQREA